MPEIKHILDSAKSVIVRSKVKWIIVALLGVFLLCQLVSYRARTPRHIDVSIPEIDDHWDFVEHTMRVWRGSWSRDAILVKRIENYGSTCDNKCSSIAELAAYFDSQLIEQGWLFHLGSSHSCQSLLPEIQFLQNVPESHIAHYRNREPTDWGSSPEVCFGI